MTFETTTTALNFELPVDATGKVQDDWWPIVPAGKFQGRDKRTFINNNPEAIVEALEKQQRDVVLDVEHSTEIKAPKGEPAPARGRFKRFGVQNGVVMGEVSLNSKGRELIDNEEYMYYSPGLIHDRSGHVVGVSSVGLTNKHNLFLPALNHENASNNSLPTNHEEITMELSTALCQQLGISDDSDQTAILAKVKQLQDTNVSLNSQQAATPDPAKFIPIESYQTALNRATEAEGKLVALNQEKVNQQATDLVDKAIEDKKVSPANRDHFIALCRQEDGFDQVKTLLDSAPVIDLDSKHGEGAPAGGQSSLTTEQVALCQQLDIDPEQYKTALSNQPSTELK